MAEEDVLIRIVTQLEGAVDDLNKLLSSITAIGDASKQTEDKTGDFFSDLEDHLDETTRSAQKFSREMESALDDATDSLAPVVEGMEAVVQEVARADEAVQPFAAHLDASGDAAESAGTSVQSLGGEAEALAQSIEQADTEQQSFVEHLEDGVKQTEQAVEQFDLFGNAVAESGERVVETAENLGGLKEATEDAAEVQLSFADQLERSAERATDLSDAVKQIREEQEGYRKEIEELTDDEKDLVKELLQHGESLDKVAEAAHVSTGAIEQFRDKIEETDQVAGGFFEKLLHNFGLGEAASIALGIHIAKVFDLLIDGAKNVLLFIPRLTTQSARLGDELLQMSRRTNVSVEALSELRFVASQTGVPLEALSRMVFELSARLGEGGVKIASALRQIGLSIQELRKLPREEALFTILKALQQVEDASRQAALGTQIFGNRFRITSGLLREDIDKIRREFKDFGLEISTEFAEQGNKYNAAVDVMEKTTEKFRNEIASYLLPFLTKAVELFPRASATVISFFQNFGNVGANLATIISGAKDLPDLIRNLKSVFGAGVDSAKVIRGFGDAAAAASGGVQLLNTALSTGGLLGLLRSLAGPMAVLLGVLILAEKLKKELEKMPIEKRRQMASQTPGGVGFYGIEAERLKKEYEQRQSVVDKYSKFTTPGGEGEPDALAKQFSRGATAINDASSMLAELVAQTKEYDKEIDKLTPKEKELIKYLFEHGRSAEEIASTGVATVEVLGRFKSKIEEQKRAFEASPIGKFTNDIKALGVAISNAEKAGAPFNAVIEKFGQTAVQTIDQAKLIPDALGKVPQKVKDIATAWTDSEIDKRLIGIHNISENLAQTWKDTLRKAAESGTASLEQSFAAIQQAANLTAEDAITRLTGLEAEVARIEQARGQAIAAARAATQADEEARNQQIAAINAHYDLQLQLAKRFTDDVVKNMELRGLATQQALEAELQVEQQVLDQMVEARAAGDKRITDAALAAQHERVAAYEEETGVFRDAWGAVITDVDGKIKMMTKTVNEGLENAKKIAEDLAISDISDSRERQQAQADKDLQREIERIRKKYRTQGAAGKEAMELEIKNAEEAYRKKIAIDKRYTGDVIVDAEHRGIKTKAQLQEEYETERKVLEDMKRARGVFTRDAINKQKEIVRGAKEAAEGERSAWKRGFDGVVEMLDEVANGFQRLAQVAGEGMGKFATAMTFAATIAKDVQQLLEAKDAIGAFIAAVHLAVDAVAGLWDALTKTPGEDVKDRVRQWGVLISEELGDQIAETAKKRFRGSRDVAEIFHLQDIVDAAGGLNTKNFDMFVRHLRDTFSFIEQGLIDVDEASEILDKDFGMFADHVLKHNKLAADGFVELLRLQAAFGTQSKEMTQFVESQTGRAASAIGTLFTPLDKPVADMLSRQTKLIESFSEDTLKKLREGYEEAQKGADKYTGSFEQWVREHGRTRLAGEELIKYNKLLEDIEPTLTAMTEQTQRFERLTLAAFNAAVASGLNYFDALEKIAPNIDKLVELQKELGIAAGPAMQELMRVRELVKANPELVQAAGSLNEVALALSNIGGLTQESLLDLRQQGVDTFNRLIAAGFTENQALLQMKGYLETIRDAHEKLGIAYDEGTNHLIAQAEAQGILAEKSESTNDILKEGLSEIIRVLGGELPAAWRQMATSAQDAAGRMGQGFIDAAARAREAADAVNAVTYGSSPGGLKDIQSWLDRIVPTVQKVGSVWDKVWGKAKDATDDANDILEGDVLPKLVDVEGQLKDTPWGGWADATLDAGFIVGRELDDVNEALLAIENTLRTADWTSWADQMVDAARSAQEAIDGLSFGQSPGGIKEIPLQLDRARRATERFADSFISEIDSAKNLVDALSLSTDQLQALQGSDTGAAQTTGGPVGDISITLQFPNAVTVDATGIQRLIDSPLFVQTFLKALRHDAYGLRTGQDAILKPAGRTKSTPDPTRRIT